MIRVCGMQFQVSASDGSVGRCRIADESMWIGNTYYPRGSVLPAPRVPEPIRCTLEIEVSPEGADLLSRVTAESIALGCGLDGLAKVLDEARWVAK